MGVLTKAESGSGLMKETAERGVAEVADLTSEGKLAVTGVAILRPLGLVAAGILTVM